MIFGYFLLSHLNNAGTPILAVGCGGFEFDVLYPGQSLGLLEASGLLHRSMQTQVMRNDGAGCSGDEYDGWDSRNGLAEVLTGLPARDGQ